MRTSRHSEPKRSETESQLAEAEAKLASYRRVASKVLFLLLLAAVFILGLVVGHISGVPWLSHRH